MAAWRTLGAVVVLLTLARAGRAQTYPLAEEVKAGDCFRVRLEMTLAGDIRIHRDGKPASLPLKAQATHEFPERVLAVGAGGGGEKAARLYETAAAAITVDGDRSERTLRQERR